MSYSEVKYESFIDTVSDLVAKGHVISVKKVMAVTGGSHKTISRYLVKYFEDQLIQRARPPVPSELTKVFQNVIQHQVLMFNKETNEQLVAQGRVLREVQGINAELLDRLDEKNREVLEIQALCDCKCKQISAERATAANVENELERELDEVSTQYVSAKKEFVEIQIENARLVAKLEQELSARVERENRFDNLNQQLRLTQEELQNQQVVAAAAHAETIAGGDHLMSLHAILAQRDREVTEFQDRLLQICSRQTTTEVVPPAKSPPVRPSARVKGSKASRSLKK